MYIELQESENWWHRLTVNSFVIKVKKEKKGGKGIKKKKTTEKTKEKVSGGREEGHIPGCQCGGLMVAVPGLQAISLCYQVK